MIKDLKQSKLLNKLIAALLLIVIFSIVFSYVYNFRHNSISKNSSNWSDFSTYLNGTIGTIVSFISLYLIYKTYNNQVINSLTQQFDTTFFSLLQTQRDILKALHGSVLTKTGIGEFSASEYFEAVAEQIHSNFDSAVGQFKNADGKSPHEILSKQEIRIQIDTIYRKIYKGQAATLGHYFRHLYHLFKYIDGSQIDDKRKYADIVAAQMDDNELYVTLYNGISDFSGDTFPDYLDHYQTFENIKSRGKIFNKHKTLFYPKTIFKDNDE